MVTGILRQIYGELQMENARPIRAPNRASGPTIALTTWVRCRERGSYCRPTPNILIVHCSKKGAAAVLDEWIRNIPLTLVERIVADRKVRGNHIWNLALAELGRRRHHWGRAA